MMACESGIDRLLKVRYLTNKGADCQVKDMVGVYLSRKIAPFFFYLVGKDGLVLCRPLHGRRQFQRSALCSF